MARLSDDELREVLVRAEEIERSSRLGSEWNAEVTAVVRAAEEVGISPAAVERALMERRDFPSPPPTPGMLVWAGSADGKSYVAEVVTTAEHEARVRFLSGSEDLVSLDKLAPCLLIPGQRIMCDWPWWGAWNCSLISYDKVTQRVKVSDRSGSTETFPLAEVWLPPPKDPRATRTRVYVALLAAGAVAGALSGSIVTALFLR